MGPRTAATLLGISLGGFFDGILLHQILQWHHLLSLVDGLDLRGQVLWDGLFHLAHYLLAVLGLWGLWRHRAAAPPVLPALLLGFGLWHLIDAVLSHWLLGIHRIRVDAADPLAWDLGWLAAFGLLPIALALLLRGRGPGAPGLGVAALALVAALAGLWSARVPDDRPFAVVFRPGAGLGTVLDAMAATDARLVAGDPHAGVVVVEAASPWTFYRHGAILVGGAGLPAGCAAWNGIGEAEA